jgi:hypothetical protein
VLPAGLCHASVKMVVRAGGFTSFSAPKQPAAPRCTNKACRQLL